MKNTKKLLSVLAAVILVVGAIAAPAMTVGAASTTPALSIDYCNLAFEDTVHIKYAVASDAANVSVLVWTSPAASYTYGTHAAELTAYTTETIGEDEYKVFTYDKLAAKHMTDVVYAAVYANVSGTAYYSQINKYSVLQYAYNMMGKTAAGSTDAELVALLGDMLSYGASAQKYFNYNETRLADASFYQVKLTDGALDDGCTHGLYLAGDTVTMTAPATNETGVAFGYWADSTGAAVATTADYTLTVAAKNETYTPVYGIAPEPEYSKGLEYESNGDGTCILLGMGTFEGTDLVIPATSPDGDSVTEIDASAFAGEALTSVSFPSTITYIGRRAFNGCTSLTDVYYDGTEAEWTANVEISTYNDPIENATMHFKTPAPDPTPDVTYTEPTIAVCNVSAGAGDTVEVTVSIYNNPGLCGAKLKLTHDEKLSLQGAVEGSALEILDYTAPETSNQPYYFNWDGMNDDAVADGIILKLTFKVADTAVQNEELAVELTYTDGDVYNKNIENVTLDCVNGSVTVK